MGLGAAQPRCRAAALAGGGGGGRGGAAAPVLWMSRIHPRVGLGLAPAAAARFRGGCGCWFSCAPPPHIWPRQREGWPAHTTPTPSGNTALLATHTCPLPLPDFRPSPEMRHTAQLQVGRVERVGRCAAATTPIGGLDGIGCTVWWAQPALSAQATLRLSHRGRLFRSRYHGQTAVQGLTCSRTPRRECARRVATVDSARTGRQQRIPKRARG